MRHAPAVILIGIDGGTLDLIGPWVAAGELPALGALLAGGASGPLRSTQPPLTPVAWSSLLTGCSPARHGIHGFLRIPRDDYAPEFLSGGALSLPTFLELLSARGARVGVINMPWTWPPRPVSGFWLSGLDAPAFGPEIAHPPGLFEALCARFGRYFDKAIPPRRDAYELGRLDGGIQRLGVIARHLCREHAADVLAMVFTLTDQVQHWFWRDRSVTTTDGRRVDDLLLHTYRRVDEQIARTVEELAGERTTVIVASDHGAGPCEGGINLNRWLADHGWLRLRTSSPRRGLRGLALRLGQALPLSVRERLRGRLAVRRRRMLSQVLAEVVDWPRTQAFCWSDYGAISVHRSGRFAHGTVSEARADALADEIAQALLEMRDPRTGERVMSAPLRDAELHGARNDDAPDLLAVTRGYRREILSEFTPAGPLPGELAGATFGPSLRQATHRLDGLVCLHGRGVRVGRALQCARIEDVAPTVMHLLGQPVPEYMDGRVLSEAFTRDALRVHAPGREAVDVTEAERSGRYSDAERARIERELGALGYL